jgi:hypothetical protein
METPDARHLIHSIDYAELMLIHRRAEFLHLRSDTVAWRNPDLREKIENAYSDVKDGIGVNQPLTHQTTSKETHQ